MSQFQIQIQSKPRKRKFTYPLGVFGIPVADFPRYTGALFTLNRTEIISYLSAAQAAGTRLILSVAGRSSFIDGSGNWVLANWKSAMLSKYENLDLSPYINDGTLIGIAMIDEPQDNSNWNGSEVPYADIDECARYCKTVIPGVKTWVGSLADWLGLYTQPYVYLDGVFCPYTSAKGTPQGFADNQVAQAKRKGLRIFLDTNSEGGNNGGEMTPAQLETWLTVFMNKEECEGSLVWRYATGTYYTRPDVIPVVNRLVAIARTKTVPT